MSSGGFRVSIPNSARKTILNIKEITGNHSDEDIYAMLQECSMDPNETTQKLLLQDPFHEVKRKRERRKENTSNKDSAEPRWRPNLQERVSKGGRMNYLPRHAYHDASGSRNSAHGKEFVSNQVSGDVVAILPFPSTRDNKTKEKNVTRSVTVMTNNPPALLSGGSSGVNQSELPSKANHKDDESTPCLPTSITPLQNLTPCLPTSITPLQNLTIPFGEEDTSRKPSASFVMYSGSVAPATRSVVCFSSSDPVLVPSNDSRLLGTMGTFKREMGSQRALDANVLDETKSTAETETLEMESSFVQESMSTKSQAIGNNQFTETSQLSPLSAHSDSSFGRPSSSYNFRSQQGIGPQKAVGPSKEWKPKATNSVSGQWSGATSASEPSTHSVEAGSPLSKPALNAIESKDATSKVLRKFGGLRIQDHQHVIIPNHIHVPESERSGLSFGSIDARFGISTKYVGVPENDEIFTAASESSHDIEETPEEQPAHTQNSLPTSDEGAHNDHPQSPKQVCENLSSIESDVSVRAIPEYSESKQQEAALSHGGQQYSMHTSPTHGFGFTPPMLGSQLAQFENFDTQSRGASRVPSFLVQQSFDPSSYYSQFYRSGTDSDGQMSPFPLTGVASKHNGNVTLLSLQTSETQEGGNSLVLPTAVPTSLVTQAGPISVTQQPVTVFRPPTGMHISHYPPNYIPYGHYFSPFYPPPPAIHQFLSDGAFSQQPQAGSVYAAPAAAVGTGAKYSVSQFKPGANTGNSAHNGMSSGYGPYGSSLAGYNPSTAAIKGNSTSNEDITASQFKESNVYIPGQQSEGSAVWVSAPGRDISGLPASSFYNLPQGHHVTFAQPAGHANFAGIYHPGQAVATSMVHHPLIQQSQAMAGSIDTSTNIYQHQPQHSQVNWPNY